MDRGCVQARFPQVFEAVDAPGVTLDVAEMQIPLSLYAL